MTKTTMLSPKTIPQDLIAGLVVFFVALPLCLGVALASNAPLVAGIVSGVIGGILVGSLSGSHTSVSGPAAGLTAIVAAEIAALGSFNAFLFAVMIAGLLQVTMGVLRAGAIAVFVPSSVIKGLLAAIGVILILKQIPHLLGHDKDPEGDMAFQQADGETTITEIIDLANQLHWGAALIGILSVVLLVVWDNIKTLKKSPVPAPLIVVLLGVVGNYILSQFGDPWQIGATHLVQVPEVASLGAFASIMPRPDFSQWNNPAIYTAGFTIAIVASLETLLNLEAVDKLDPRRRNSPPSRELVAQGLGNLLGGFVGALPMTSVIVRSSVNINAGGKTKLAAIFHGILLLVCVLFLPRALNHIPLSCLAAILLVTGIKLASPKLVRQMWREGYTQFIPFVITVLAIVLTDLLIGVIIGLVVSIAFILRSNIRRPLRRIIENHLGGEVLRIELANQVSFLNRATLSRTLKTIPRGSHVLLDASNTVYVDPDVLGLIREYTEEIAPAHGVHVSLRGFREKYALQDHIQYVDYATRELQARMTPQQVLRHLLDGNARFRHGERLTRDNDRQIIAAASGQHPLAVILSCIDSRTPAELIFDLGLGDIFSIRVAGNIPSREILASVEYGCKVAGAKLVMIVGHTRCGAVTAAFDLTCSHAVPSEVTGCQHLAHIVDEIKPSVDLRSCPGIDRLSTPDKQSIVDEVARRNVLRTVDILPQQSETLRSLLDSGSIKIVGAMYDIASGEVEILGGERSEQTTEMVSTDGN